MGLIYYYAILKLPVPLCHFDRAAYAPTASMTLRENSESQLEAILREREEGAAKAEKLEGRFSDKDEKRET